MVPQGMATIDALWRERRRREEDSSRTTERPEADHREPLSAIAQLQRSAGNQAVARLLTRARPEAALLQRYNGESDDEDGVGQQQQLQLLLPRDEQQSAAAPEVTVSVQGSPTLKITPNKAFAVSAGIDIVGKWIPTATPPNGHSPDANVGWIQNLNHCNEQADYFADGNYVESSWIEYNGAMVDGDDADVWYDPPRPYSDVAQGTRAALLGNRPQQRPVGAALFDKPQSSYPMVSPQGGKLYRFGGALEFSAYLVIAEPDWRRGTVLETIQWKYEYAYSLPDVNAPAGTFVEDYAQTYVVSRTAGVGDRTPNMEKGGMRANVFANDVPVSWEQINAGRDPNAERFPSFI
jgi:hypothetical protein